MRNRRRRGRRLERGRGRRARQSGQRRKSSPTFAGGSAAVGGVGGFGGGGGGGSYGGGGGGGYSGGGGSLSYGGGGGGSYADPSVTVTSSVSGARAGDGEVTIDGTSVGTAGGIVSFTITTTATYDIVAYGAEGGGFGDVVTGGLGAEYGGDVGLLAGTVLDILVGEAGGSVFAAGGGGGSFVWIASEPATVPEPSTWATLLIGFAGLAAAGRRAGARRA